MTYLNISPALRVLETKYLERAAVEPDPNRSRDCLNHATRFGQLAHATESTLTSVYLKEHRYDEDCTVDPATDLCIGCGVMHGDPCPACGQKAFHLNDCPELGIEVPAEEDNIGGLPFGLTAPALLYMAVMLAITAWIVYTGLHLHN